MIYYLHQVICRQERSDKSVIVSTYFTAAETNKDIQRHRRLLLTSEPRGMCSQESYFTTSRYAAVSCFIASVTGKEIPRIAQKLPCWAGRAGVPV
jgi:hypothetical protein